MALPSILYWEDPVTTGGLFGSVLVVLLSLTSYSLITVVSYSCLTALLAVLGVKLYSYVMVMMKEFHSRVTIRMTDMTMTFQRKIP